jgi:hypothetical protein
MTRPAALYDLAGPEIPPSADAPANGNREPFLGTSPIREDPMNRASRQPAPHYDPWLAELSTPPGSDGSSIGPCARFTRSTEATMRFLDCPAYLDQNGALRCGLPAEVTCRFTMHSTVGPMQCAIIICPAGHSFAADIESLTLADQDDHDPGTAGAGSCAADDSFQRGHNGRHAGGGSVQRELPAEPERILRRPHGAPAYYLGRPVGLYITAMRARRCMFVV